MLKKISDEVYRIGKCVKRKKMRLSTASPDSQ